MQKRCFYMLETFIRLTMLGTIEFNHQNCCTFLPLIRYICAVYLIPFTLGSFLRVYLQALILGNYVSLLIMLIYLAHTQCNYDRAEFTWWNYRTFAPSIRYIWFTRDMWRSPDIFLRIPNIFFGIPDIAYLRTDNIYFRNMFNIMIENRIARSLLENL